MDKRQGRSGEVGSRRAGDAVSDRGIHDYMQYHADDPRLIKVYRRILRAAKTGRGIRLNCDDVAEIALDDAISACVITYDENRR